jgi:hypothetical protein
MMQERYYSPSGRFGKMTIPMFLLAGLLLLPILGFVYAFLVEKIPFIYVRFFATIGYAYTAFMILGFCVKIGKIRSSKAYFIGAIVVLLLGYYVHWAAFFSIALSAGVESVSFFDILASPSGLKMLVDFYNESGISFSKSGSGGKVWNGGVLYFIWFVEFAIMVLGPLLAGYTKANEPYSELNDDWFTENKLGGILEITKTEEEIKTDLENNDYAILENAHKADVDFDVFYRISLYDSAGDEDYLTLKKVKVAYEKGERKESESDVVEYLRIPNDLTQRLKMQWA